MGYGAGQVVYEDDFNAIFAGCKLRQAVAQGPITHNTATAINFDTADWDSRAWSNGAARVTPDIAGKYGIHWAISLPARSDWTLFFSYVRRNGVDQVVPAARDARGTTNSTSTMFSGYAEIDLNGSSDYVEIIFQASNGAAANFTLVVSGPQASFVSVRMLDPT